MVNLKSFGVEKYSVSKMEDKAIIVITPVEGEFQTVQDNFKAVSEKIFFGGDHEEFGFTNRVIYLIEDFGKVEHVLQARLA